MAGQVKLSRKTRAIKFSKAILQGKTQVQAAIEAGYSAKSADSKGSQLAKSPDIQAIVNSALDKAGATLQASAEVIARNHKAKKVQFFAHQGVVISAKATDDGPTQLHAAELNLRARKVLSPVSHEDQDPRSIVNLVALVAVVKQAAQQRGLPI